MSRRHADNWSHPGHYLVDPYTWPWSPNGHGHGEWPTATPFVQCQSALPFWDTAISKFDHENPWSRSCVWSKVKVMFDLQNSKVKVMVKVKPIGHLWSLEFNRYVCFSFRGNQTIFGRDIANSIFDLEKSRSRSWSRSNLMVTIGLPILRYSYFKIWPWKSMVKVMCGQRSRSRLTFKIQRSRLWSRSNPLVTFEAWSSIDTFAFRFVAIRPFLAEI